MHKSRVAADSGLMDAVLFPDRNRASIVKVLLDHGASPNAMDDEGGRPLTYVNGPGRFKYIDLLLKYGAKLNTKDTHGLTILARVKREQNLILGAPNDVLTYLRKLGAR